MNKRIFWLMLLVLTLNACTGGKNTPSSTAPAVTPSPQATLAPASPTPHPNQLIICATEPQAASPFIATMASRELQTLFLEMPAERVNYRWEPRLLERIPDLTTGDVSTRTVPVTNGTQYVDITGQIVTSTSRATLNLPQMIVTFTLRSGLKWSDGEPLTTDDILLGYHLAQDPAVTGSWHNLAERTARFVAVNEQTLRWEGLPGMIGTDFPGYLFPPQPAHRWRGQSLEQILKDRTPPGTGPFMIEAWESGREIRLVPNPYYNGTAPRLDKILIHFPQTSSLNQWPSLLASGQCDIALPDPIMGSDWQSWSTLAAQGKVTLWANVSPVFLRLDFNIQRTDDRPNSLAAPEVRTAIATCIDRSRLVKALPGNAILVAESIIPPQHPGFSVDNQSRIAYDTAKGQSILENYGWRDEDKDGIREAHKVPGIPDGTPLTVTLSLPSAYTVPAAHISADLESCGIGITPQTIAEQIFYSTDPASPIAGRTFDLALFGWQAQVPLVCGTWFSNRIPNLDNQWKAENFPGYTSNEYDAACRRALTTPDLAEQQLALKDIQTILARDLPTLPLLWRPYWFVARPEIQGIQPDASAPSALWNIESISISQ